MTYLYCGIVFNVKEWLKPYVDMNTELRNKCKKEGQAIGTIVYKLMNNAIYGKFLQNVMKQSNLKFVNTLLDAIQIQGAITAWLCEECIPAKTMGTSP